MITIKVRPTHRNMFIIFVLFVVLVFGYVSNVVQLFYATDIFQHGESILRIIGVVVPPIGVVMGYL